MTEPIAVDIPAKPSAAPKSATTFPAVPKLADKPESPKATDEKPAEGAKPSTPAKPASGGIGSFLGSFVSKRQAAIGASAVFSMIAGIAGVGLLFPPDGPDT